MATLDIQNLTLEPENVQAMNEAIYSDLFSRPSLTAFHTVLEGIKNAKTVPVLGLMGSVGFTAGSNCTPDASGAEIPASEFTWELGTMEDRLTNCWKDLKDAFTLYVQKNGIERADLEGAYMVFIEGRLADAIEEAIWRIAYFGDKQASNVGSGSGSELVTVGVNIRFVNTINGFWKQVFAIVAGDATKRFTLPGNPNGAVSKALQLTLAADLARNTFRGMYNLADVRLSGLPSEQLVYLATNEIFNNYADWLESQNVDSSFIRNENGFVTLRYRGIDVVKMDKWSRDIKTFFNLGSTFDKPNRALLTTKQNALLLGVESVGSLGSFDTWYEKKDRTVYTDLDITLDAKIPRGEMIVSAY